ncbi:hypothetical protein DPMN_045682 [Dreissena polymorpha]|uniref:Uncharacterized protein n=1 Tax=Dreissena polymorpha TaxID=45954 RepID=A0A9D4D5C8_DREPO|nr:hypothetical protein DPMN_045682 [Dreissena polymorpha]
MVDESFCLQLNVISAHVVHCGAYLPGRRITTHKRRAITPFLKPICIFGVNSLKSNVSGIRTGVNMAPSLY